MYHVFAAEDVSRANSRRKASCDYGAANTEGGRRNGLEEGDGGGCHSSKLPACRLDVRWQSDKKGVDSTRVWTCGCCWLEHNRSRAVPAPRGRATESYQARSERRRSRAL
jgi:hypothetical protein